MIDLSEFINDFRSHFRAEPRLFAAPGRVNLIGEHTDYNDGFVLPFALQERTYVACSRSNDGRVRAITRTLNEAFEMDVNGASGSYRGSWTVYVRGIAEILVQASGSAFQGANLLIDSEVPFGAGLSSSAAFEVALGLALSVVSGLKNSPKEIALWGQRVEHEFVGLRSGIMDQLASAMSREKHLLLIDCRSLETTNIPFAPPDMLLAICDTKVKHDLAASQYNRRREECEDGVRILQRHLPDISSLRDVGVAQFAEHSRMLPESIRARCRHVITENDRVLNSVAAIRGSDLDQLGRLMYESHESLRADYEVSCPELDLLVETAREIPGVIGARMTGGGFGGCTINLMERAAFNEFTERTQARYRSTFDSDPNITIVRPSEGANEINTRSL